MIDPTDPTLHNVYDRIGLVADRLEKAEKDQGERIASLEKLLGKTVSRLMELEAEQVDTGGDVVSLERRVESLEKAGGLAVARFQKEKGEGEG